MYTSKINTESWRNGRIIAVIMILFVSSTVGLLSTNVEAATLIISTLITCVAFFALIIFSKMEYIVEYVLILMILSVTIHNGRIPIPFKPDSVALPILALVLLLKDWKRLFRINSYPILILILGFLLVGFTSSFINSPVFELSLRQSLILVGRCLTFFFVVIAIDHKPTINNRIPVYLSVILVFQSLVSFVSLAIYTYIPTPFVMIGQTGRLSRSINGFFLEANLFGIFALSVVSLLLPIYLFSKKNKVLLIFVMSIGVIAIILSYTRSTWIAMFLTIVCIFPLMYSNVSINARKSYTNMMIIIALFTFYMLLAIVAGTIIGVQVDLADRLTTIFDQKSFSTLHRLNVWDQAFGSWYPNIWLGRGFLSFVVVNPGSKGWLYGSIIQTLHDTGIVGLVFMILICGYGVLCSWWAYFRAEDDSNRGIALGYLLAQLSLFFTSQFSSFFWGGFYWVLLGAAISHSRYVTQISSNKGVSKLIVTQNQ